jgi:hypothetical protein
MSCEERCDDASAKRSRSALSRRQTIKLFGKKAGLPVSGGEISKHLSAHIIPRHADLNDARSIARRFFMPKAKGWLKEPTHPSTGMTNVSECHSIL